MSSEPGGPVGAVYKTGITTRDLVVYHRFRNSLIRATWAMVDSSVVGMRLLHCDRVELGSILPLWELLHVLTSHMKSRDRSILQLGTSSAMCFALGVSLGATHATAP